MLLLDSDVAIELLRGTDDAVRWFTGLPRGESVALAGLAALELLRGSGSKLDARRIEAFTSQFSIAWPSAHDCERARHTLADATLSHGIGIIDMLIAQTAIGLDATLHSFNQRHFNAVAGLHTQRPYTR